MALLKIISTSNPNFPRAYASISRLGSPTDETSPCSEDDVSHTQTPTRHQERSPTVRIFLPQLKFPGVSQSPFPARNFILDGRKSTQLHLLPPNISLGAATDGLWHPSLQHDGIPLLIHSSQEHKIFFSIGCSPYLEMYNSHYFPHPYLWTRLRSLSTEI